MFKFLKKTLSKHKKIIPEEKSEIKPEIIIEKTPEIIAKPAEIKSEIKPEEIIEKPAKIKPEIIIEKTPEIIIAKTPEIIAKPSEEIIKNIENIEEINSTTAEIKSTTPEIPAAGLTSTAQINFAIKPNANFENISNNLPNTFKTTEPTDFKHDDYYILNDTNDPRLGIYFIKRYSNGASKDELLLQYKIEYIAHIKLPLEVDVEPSAHIIKFTDRFDQSKEIEFRGDARSAGTIDSILGMHNINPKAKTSKEVADFIRAFIEQQSPCHPPLAVTERLGFDEHQTQFLLGETVYTKEGSKPVRARGELFAKMRYTKAHGSIEKWVACAKMYEGEKMEWCQATIASSLVAPMIGLLGFTGSVIASLFGGSGCGKTAVQTVAAAIWGNPHETMGAKEDTIISRFQQLGTFNSVPVQFDEMSKMLPKDISNFAYQATQGRAKHASSGDGKARHNPYRWRTIITNSTNTSLLHALDDQGGSSAEMRRIFEHQVWSISKHSTVDQATAEMRLGELQMNYGGVGHYIAQHMMQNLEQYKQNAQSIWAEIKNKYQTQDADRFYVSYIAMCMLGCTIGRQLGLFNYDANKLEEYLIKRMHVISALIDSGSVMDDLSGDIFNEFIRRNLDKTVTVKNAKRNMFKVNGVVAPDVHGAAGNDLGYVVGDLPQREIAVRRNLDTEEYVVSCQALRDWCSANRYSYAKLEVQLRDSGRLGKNEQAKTRDLAAGTERRTGLQIRCLVIKSSDVVNNDLDDDEDIDD